MSNVTRSGSGSDPNTGTSQTTFGSSVESQAQIEDAGTLSSSSIPGEPLNIYRLIPSAPPSDPRWQDATYHGEVVVAARTAGDARIVAAGRELDFLDVDALPGEDVTTRHASVFRDEKCYSVVEIEHGRTDIGRGVISGEVSVDTIKPTQV